MKPLPKLFIGITLIVLSLFALPIAFYRITPWVYINIPCKDRFDPRKFDNPRIGYCVNIHSLNVAREGTIPESGASTDDSITWDIFDFRRENQTLFIDNSRVDPGRSHQTTRWIPYMNPWLIFTVRYVIKNEGIISIDSTESAKMLYISGDAYAGWYPSPVGLIILGIGAWLVIKGIKERKQATNALSVQAG